MSKEKKPAADWLGPLTPQELVSFRRELTEEANVAEMTANIRAIIDEMREQSQAIRQVPLNKLLPKLREVIEPEPAMRAIQIEILKKIIRRLFGDDKDYKAILDPFTGELTIISNTS